MRFNSLSLDVASQDIPHVVVVDPDFEKYKSLAASARLGKLNLHFRTSGGDALKLCRRGRIDAWLVASDLDDMTGNDFVELLRSKLAETPLNAFATSVPRVALMEEQRIAGGEQPKPISFRDLERLLQTASMEPAEDPLGTPPKRAFITLPIGVGAAVVAIAVLMLS